LQHRGHQQITDAYLLALAIHHRGKLATLDQGIRAWGAGSGVEVIE
jgi:predicted nucleic acid-binding protein